MITLQQARNLHLAAQGVLQPPVRAARRADVAACIQRMGLLQIDTIHVVSRSPYLVLHSRLGDYPRAWLEDALASRDQLQPGELIYVKTGHAVGHHSVSFYAPDSEQAGLLARAQEIENLE